MKLIHDTWLIFQRQALLQVREPAWVFIGIFQPVLYLLLFAPLLRPALAPLGVTTEAEAYRIFVPGLLVLLAIFGGLFKGFGLIAELRAGIIERSRVTPISRLALLLGRSLRDAIVLVAQAGIVTMLAVCFGFTAHLGHILLAFLMLALIALMTSSISYGVALKVRNEDTFAPLMNTTSLPLFLLSGIMLPITEPFAPEWLIAVARFNPFYWTVEGTRALFAGNIADSSVWQGLLITLVLATAAIFWSARSFARSVR